MRAHLRVLRACLGSCLFAWLCVSTSLTYAQDPAAPTLSLLQTVRSRGVDSGTGSALDRMIRQRVDELGVVQVEGQVALDLEQLQIALGCLGETDACLQAVARETGSRYVLVPSLDRAEQELVASILLFDGQENTQRRASRSAHGGAAVATILEEVEPMLRELFGMPARTSRRDERIEEPSRTPIPATSREEDRGLSPWPIVLIGVGAAVLIGGGVAGGLALGDHAAYRATTVRTTADVDSALALASRAETEALAANVMFIAGGVIAAAGVTWLLAGGKQDGTSPLAVAPLASPTGVGFVMSGSLDLEGRF